MIIGLALDVWLLADDYKNGKILTRVEKGEALADILASPPPAQRREIAENTTMHENVKDYLLNRD